MTLRADLAVTARRAAISVVPLRVVGAAVRTLYPRIEPELARLGEIMPRGGTALDVGAWFGPWSTRMTRYADRVVALEAHPDLAGLLRRSLPRVSVVHAAASDGPGEIDLLVPAGGPAVGVCCVEGSTRVEAGAAQAADPVGAADPVRAAEPVWGRPVAVPRLTIDSLGLTDVRFVKMDIEGHELAALRGAERTIRRDLPPVLLELEERLQPVSRVVELLASWGYTGEVLLGPSWRPLAQFDLVAHQRETLRRVHQSFVRRLVWPRPRYVNMVLFRAR
ncbi:MAG TPA: FkbM family methyltransferase [Micromonosporaceae bacterium]|nr:FkbM family methyltransferase [Micromonosporaceae bacterium]